MGTVARFRNVRIEIRTRDHWPPHVHAVGGGAEVKIEIKTGRVVASCGFTEHFTKLIQAFVIERQAYLMEKWNEIHTKK
jgi:hypothetical protein